MIRFFRLRHTTEQIARGFAVGLTPNFFPTFGFGFLLSAFLARMVGGNAAAGVVGGLALTFFWPLLFFLNMQTGSMFIHPRILIAELDDVSEQNIEALLWGPAFTVGAVINCLLAAGVAYVLVLLFYRQIRPGALSFLRRQVRERHRPSRPIPPDGAVSAQSVGASIPPPGASLVNGPGSSSVSAGKRLNGSCPATSRTSMDGS